MKVVYLAWIAYNEYERELYAVYDRREDAILALDDWNAELDPDTSPLEFGAPDWNSDFIAQGVYEYRIERAELNKPRM